MKWSEQSQSYKRGFLEGSDDRSERNCLGIYDGVTDSTEYERGFRDGQESRKDEVESVN